jgi:pyrroline-5-carboxylate reductase
MSYRVSFIGCGNMGAALIRGVCRSIGGESVVVFDTDSPKALALAQETGCHVAPSAQAAVEASKFVVMCVKPQILGPVLEGLGSALEKPSALGRRVIVSIAAGVGLMSISGFMPQSCGDAPIIRIMPNLAAGVGMGMTLAAVNPFVSDDDYNEFAQIFGLTGEIIKTDENSLDLGTAISGCAPAFTAMFIEALADGGVEIGLSREMALKLAIQTVRGTAHMLSETGMHPAQLKDGVCSPGGSTIAGVASLEKNGFRTAAAQAVVSSNLRNIELGGS